MKNGQKKVAKVMREYKKEKLHNLQIIQKI